MSESILWCGSGYNEKPLPRKLTERQGNFIDLKIKVNTILMQKLKSFSYKIPKTDSDKALENEVAQFICDISKSETDENLGYILYKACTRYGIEKGTICKVKKPIEIIAREKTKISIPLKPTYGIRYSKCNTFAASVQTKHWNFSKTFKDLDEAINYRNNFIKKHGLKTKLSVKP